MSMPVLKDRFMVRSEPNLTDRIALRLREEITGGAYQPGDVLPPEQVIADRFGVSRTVLREAVSRLKVEGIVASKQGRGLTVVNNRPSSVLRLQAASENNVGEALSLVELRQGFEIEAAAFAALRRDDADLEEMQSALAQMEQAIVSGDVMSGVEADLRFHEAIARATKNANYITFFDFLSELYRRNLVVSRTRSSRTSGRGKPAQAEHQAIFEAMRQGDAEAARRAARVHVENTGLRLQAASAAGKKAVTDSLKSEGQNESGAPERRSLATRKGVAG